MEAAGRVDPTELRENVYGHVKKVRLLQEALARLRASRPSLSVLDVGCGNGSAVTRHIAAPGDDVLGIDMHEPSIRYAETNFGRPGLRFATTSIEHVAGRYDAVVFADVLEHVDEPGAFLNAARRVLKPGGRVLVTIPNGYGPFEWESALSRAPYVGRASLRLSDTIVAVLNKFVFAGAWSRVVSDPDVPYNEESGHVQFFTRRRFLRLAHASGFTIASARSLSLLSGPYTNYFMAPSRAFCRVNTWAADHLPAAAASAWFFELRPAGLSSQGGDMNDQTIRGVNGASKDSPVIALSDVRLPTSAPGMLL